MFKKKIKFLAICLLVLLGYQQTNPELSNNQIGFFAGSSLAAIVGAFCFNYFKNHAKNDKTYTNAKNLGKSSAIGVGVGGLFGLILGLCLKNNTKSIDAPDNKNINWSKPTVALKNLGGSCFMNTALQCELNSPLVRKALRSSCEKGTKNSDEIVAAFESLFVELLTSNNVVSPDNVHTLIRNTYFKGDFFSTQQDSEEFMRKFLKTLLEKTEYGKNLYSWEQREIRKCTYDRCNYVGNKITSNNIVNLPIKTVETKIATVESLIREFFGEEISDVSEQCSRCNKEGIFVKRRSVVTKPKRLIIQLIRFVTTGGDIIPNAFNDNGTPQRTPYVGSKIETPVSFQLRAKLLDDKLDDKTEYFLQSFHVHRGETIDHGHYVAYVKDPVKDQWYLYGDSIKSDVSIEELTAIINGDKGSIEHGTPYVLCYEQAL